MSQWRRDRQIDNYLHQIVSLQCWYWVVLSDMCFTVRCSAGQTGFNSFELHLSADITGHIFRSSVTVSRKSRTKSCLQEFLNHFSQSNIYIQHRRTTEALSALRTGVTFTISWFAPVAFNAVFAITVSTGDGNWILQDLCAHGTSVVILCQQSDWKCAVGNGVELIQKLFDLNCKC